MAISHRLLNARSQLLTITWTNASAACLASPAVHSSLYKKAQETIPKVNLISLPSCLNLPQLERVL